MNRPRIPLTVLGGHLGAGKTTLLNHVLRESRGVRLAVLADNFGGLNIDAHLLHTHRGQLLTLPTGTLHTGLGELMATLAALRDRARPPEHVLIEASGISDLGRIAQYGHLPSFRLDGTVVVVDAATVYARATDRRIGREVVTQLRGGDLLVLNKVDRITRREKGSLLDWLRALVPGACVVEATYGRLPIALLLGRRGTDDSRLQRRHTSVSTWDDSTDRRRAARYSSWSWTTREAVDEAAFRQWAQALGDGVLRAKGILFVRDDPTHRFVFQWVGNSWSLRRDAPWYTNTPCSQLTVLGHRDDLDPDLLGTTIGRCLPRMVAATKTDVQRLPSC